jgi:hypothetical protein
VISCFGWDSSSFEPGEFSYHEYNATLACCMSARDQPTPRSAGRHGERGMCSRRGVSIIAPVTGLAAVRLAIFVGFFGAAAVAIWRSDRRWARWGFVALFVLLLGGFGIAGKMSWPFFSWHLYRARATTDLSFFEMRVRDAAGHEIRLDARAIPPSMATPLNRMAERMLSLPPDDAKEVALWLMDHAEVHRERVRRDGPARSALWKFPRHQSGYRWTPETAGELGPVRELRIYRVDVRFSPDGQRVVGRAYHLMAGFHRLTEPPKGSVPSG